MATGSPAQRQSAAQPNDHVLVALDNMPGALVHTDEDLKIVFCNERFKEMYPAPPDMLRPGRPYPNFLRFLAQNGYCGAGDVEALVARRIESLRNPSGEDRRCVVRVGEEESK